MLSFVFQFHKKWKIRYSSFFVFHLNEEIKKRITETVEQIKITLII